MGDDQNGKKDEIVNDSVQMSVTVKTQKETRTIETTEDCLVSSFKEILSVKFNAAAENLLLIFAGKVMKDHMTLKQHNIKNGYTVHLVIKTTPPNPAPQPANTQSDTNNPSRGFVDLDQNPLFSLTDSQNDLPMLGHFLLDDNTVRTIMSQIPRIQELIESNPRFNHMINNPELINQILSLASDPASIQNFLRHGSGLANIPPAASGLGIELILQAIEDIISRSMAENPGPFPQVNSAEVQGQENAANAPETVPPATATATTDASTNQASQAGRASLLNLVQHILRNNDSGGQNTLAGQNVTSPNYAMEIDRLTSLLTNIRETMQETEERPEELYRDELEQLRVMGFENREENLRALIVSFGNVTAAIDRLLNQNSENLS